MAAHTLFARKITATSREHLRGPRKKISRFRVSRRADPQVKDRTRACRVLDLPVAAETSVLQERELLHRAGDRIPQRRHGRPRAQYLP